MEKPYTLYILICGSKAEFYTGISSNLEKRLRSHQLADKQYVHRIKQWTKNRQPVQLAFQYDGLENKIVALKVERYIKNWKRVWKEMLCKGDEFSLSLVKRCHQKSLEEYLAKSSISLHLPQTLHPYTVHTRK